MKSYITKFRLRGVNSFKLQSEYNQKLFPDRNLISGETFLAHFLNGPLQQTKKQFTVTLKFRNERLSKYYWQNVNVTI